MSYHIYGIGNALVDQEFEIDDAFFTKAGIEKGMMTLIDEQQLASMLDTLNSGYGLKKRACGGSAANTIIGASYFGAKTFYTCNVASDETGDFYVADLKAAGVDTNMDGARDEGGHDGAGDGEQQDGREVGEEHALLHAEACLQDDGR